MNISLTASALRAILAYIDPQNTPKIAYDNDALAQPLIDKVKRSVADRDGSQKCHISFADNELELLEQFVGVCKNISYIFKGLHHVASN